MIVPNAHCRDAGDIAAELGTDSAIGLSSAEAARLLEAHGPNELPSTPPVPAWKRFLAQFNDPLVYLLLLAIVISTIAWVLEGAHSVPVDSLVILAVVTLNASSKDRKSVV